MPFFTDQTGRTVDLHGLPKRIVSLVPSQTELLFDLGLEEEVIAITRFCIHPEEWFLQKTRVGGTKTLHLQKIRELRPDLILANKEENVKEQIEELAREFPVWVSDISNLQDALSMIVSVGEMTGRPGAARSMAERIHNEFSALEATSGLRHHVKGRAAYLIWRNPWMSVGRDTFIHDILTRAGFHNVFDDRTRYPETSLEELRDKQCEWVLLSSEPYPFREKHLKEIQSILPAAKVLLADGEMFSWYGSRLLKTGSYLKGLAE